MVDAGVNILEVINTPTFSPSLFFPKDLIEEETIKLLNMYDLDYENTYIPDMKNCYEIKYDDKGEQYLKFIKKINPHEFMDRIQKIKNGNNGR